MRYISRYVSVLYFLLLSLHSIALCILLLATLRSIWTAPRAPLTLPRDGSGLGAREVADQLADINPATVHI